MSTKQTTTPTVTKTWQVKVTIPWIVILVGAALLVGNMHGWNSRSEQLTTIQREVSQQVELVTKTDEQKK